MRKYRLETAVGLFVLLGVISLGYLSVRLGKLDIVGDNSYEVYANFDKAGGVKSGASVEVAGVDIGRVKDVRLGEDYQAVLKLAIRSDVRIPEDAIASIKTKGLIGEKYVQISPGASEEYVPPGGEITETESSVDIEELVSKFVFGKI